MLFIYANKALSLQLEDGNVVIVVDTTMDNILSNFKSCSVTAWMQKPLVALVSADTMSIHMSDAPSHKNVYAPENLQGVEGINFFKSLLNLVAK